MEKDYHFRDGEPTAIYDNGTFVCYSIMKRRVGKHHQETYAETYRLLPQASSTTVQCLFPFCAAMTRNYKSAFSALDTLSFANVLKHLAIYHPSELSNEDRVVALAGIAPTAAEKAGGGVNVVHLLMATPTQRLQERKSKNKALVERVRAAFTALVTHGGLVFSITEGFNKLLQVDDASPLQYPSRRTVVRDVHRALDVDKCGRGGCALDVYHNPDEGGLDDIDADTALSGSAESLELGDDE